jgi:lipoprotein-anchoring transpeptidase ErfK/SrfK
MIKPVFATHKFTRRRGIMATVGASAGLALSRLGGFTQEIEPIGAESTEEPVEIQPETTLPSSSSRPSWITENDQYFAQTGHNLGVPFLETWIQFGGISTFGVPLSELRYMPEVVESHQTFEAMTFRYDPDMPEDERIQGLPLEKKVIEKIADSADRKKESRSGSGTWVERTGFMVSGLIEEFWQTSGGELLLGAPVSRAFLKNGTTTQVFENSVIDLAANGTVGLRRLGKQWVIDNRLESDPAFLPNPPSFGETTLVSSPAGLRLRSGPSLEAEVIVVLDDNASFIAVAGAEGEWVPGYVDGYSGWVAGSFLRAPSPAPVASTDTGAIATGWNASVWSGIALSETNVRAEPTTASATVREIPYGEPLTVVAWVRGEEVVENSYIWAQLSDGNYVFARNVARSAPVAPIPVPDNAPWEGRWIDIQLTQQLMVAYEGRTPVRTIVVTTGMPGWETPTGLYYINVRVENETMTSGAIGAEYYYKLENVLYTQYFTDRGHAFHYAWWRTPETIGRPGSHGCINMLLDDSEFMWNWATYGTPIFIRTV